MTEYIATLSLTIIAVGFVVFSVLYFLIGTPYYLSRIAKSLEKKDESEDDAK